MRITKNDLNQLINRWLAIADQMAPMESEEAPSIFEIFTAAALDHFWRKRVDVSILETGLGGRLDATNVVLPKLCIITTVGLDHQNILGETIGEIALEKAGILKKDIPVILGKMPTDAEEVVRAHAARMSSPILSTGRLSIPPMQYLHGVEQVHNYPVAISAIYHWLRLTDRFTLNTWRKCHVEIRTTRWPGRWDLRTIQGQTWIFDCTLNGCGLPMLQKNWENFRAGRDIPPTVITGMLGLRRAEALLPYLASIAGELFLVALDEERATPTDAMQQLIPSYPRGRLKILRESELSVLPTLIKKNVALVTGSIHLCGKMLRAMELCFPSFIGVEE